MPIRTAARRACLPTVFTVCLCLIAGQAAAQDQGRERGDRPDARERERGDNDERDERDRDRRDRWRIDDDDTSENNAFLERIIDRYPDADTNEDGILDADEARSFIEQQRDRRRDRRRGRWNRNRLEPTHQDIAYGPHQDHTLDLYLAEADQPTPLVVFFHGGQFITGSKDQLGTLQVKDLVEAGISVASVDYRDTNLQPFPAPFEDAARAVQFLRFYSAQINVDPTRIGGHGEEAGGNLALYLALHDDQAVPRDEIEPAAPNDPDAPADAEAGENGEPAPLPSILPEENDGEEEGATADDELDALLRDGPQPWELPEIATASTRLACVVARHPIATFDPREWKRLDLPMNDHERLMRKYLAVRYLDPVDDEDVAALVEEVSPLALASADDPPALLLSQYQDLELTDDTVWTIMRHHPKQSKLIADRLKHATVRYRGMPEDPGTTSVEFFIEKLKPGE